MVLGLISMTTKVLAIMVSIRRKRTFSKSFTVIKFDKYNVYEWPTSEYEHGEIMKIFKQDKPYDGIINDFTIYRKLLEGNKNDN